MKKETIEVPNGYELKQVAEGKWELVKEEPTLEQILGHCYTLSLKTFGTAATIHYNGDEQQIEKLSALSKLTCVANYLNEGWKPNYSDKNEQQYFIAYSPISKSLNVYYRYQIQTGVVGFKSEELAKQALEICGEDLIRTALGV